MKLIKSNYEILEQKPGLEGIYEMIETAGRTCYRSQRPEGQTAKDFVDRMIKSGHGAMLEHGTAYLKIPVDWKLYEEPCLPYRDEIDEYLHNKYSKCTTDEHYIYLSTNYRVIIENEWEDLLEYLCEPTEHHEKRVTVRFTTSNSIMREFTRHRTMSFAVESTRYCNYSKDKFNNEITFIAPYWVDDIDIENIDNYLYNQEYILSGGAISLINSLFQSEQFYLKLIKDGAKPQEAREVLPLATKCNMVMTGFASDWEHLFRLRSRIAATGKPHPDMQALIDPLMDEFVARGYMESLV